MPWLKDENHVGVIRLQGLLDRYTADGLYLHICQNQSTQRPLRKNRVSLPFVVEPELGNQKLFRKQVLSGDRPAAQV